MIQLKKEYFVWMYSVGLVINVYLLYQMYAMVDVNKCKCADDVRRTYIIWYLIFTLVYVSIMIYMYTSHRYAYFAKLDGLWVKAIIPLSVLYGYLSFSYIKSLKDNECNCINPLHQLYFKYVSTALGITFSVTGFVFLAGIMGFGWWVYKKNKVV